MGAMSLSPVPWEALLAEIARGDQAALAAFYDRTSRLVYGQTYRILGESGAAEEVTLDVYLQVWRQAGNYDPGRGTPIAWLMMIARSRALDRLRASGWRGRESEPMAAAAAVAAPARDPEEESALAERRRLVRSALAELGPGQREAIELAYYHGLSHLEIAERLGLPLGTVKTRIRLGMGKLRERLYLLD